MALSESAKGYEFQERIRILLIDRDERELELLQEKLTALGIFSVVAKTASYAQALPLIGRHHPDFVLLAADPADRSDLETIEAIGKSPTRVRTIVLGKGLDASRILSYFRAGAVDYIESSIHKDELLNLFNKLHTYRKVEMKPAEELGGQVIGVWGSRGGCGTTTVACNLAYHLQTLQPTVLVDLNVWQRDLSLFLDLRPAYTLDSVLGAGERIDETLVMNLLSKYGGDLSILPLSLDHPIPAVESLHPDLILDLLKKNFRYVVLDLGNQDSPLSQIYYLVNQILLILNQDLPSLHLAKRKLKFLETANFAREDLYPVLNKFSKTSEISSKHILTTLEVDRMKTIREDLAAVSAAVNLGKPVLELKKRSYPARDIAELADGLVRKNEPVRNPNAEHILIKPLFERSLFWNRASEPLKEGRI